MVEIKIEVGTEEKVVSMYVRVCLCVHRLHVGRSLHIAPMQIYGLVPTALAIPPSSRCGV